MDLLGLSGKLEQEALLTSYRMPWMTKKLLVKIIISGQAWTLRDKELGNISE